MKQDLIVLFQCRNSIINVLGTGTFRPTIKG